MAKNGKNRQYQLAGARTDSSNIIEISGDGCMYKLAAKHTFTALPNGNRRMDRENDKIPRRHNVNKTPNNTTVV